MSVSNADTIPPTSPAARNTEGRSTQSSNRGKQPSRPRKRHYGKTTLHRGLLTIDRAKPQTTNGTQLDSTQRAPMKPPGLSTSAEAASETEARPLEDDNSEGELCFICGNSMKGRYYSLAPCNNAFCHNCSLRLRALYKSTNCPFCKVHCYSSFVLIADGA